MTELLCKIKAEFWGHFEGIQINIARVIAKLVWPQQSRDFLLHVSDKVAEIGEKESRRKQEINFGKGILSFAFVMFSTIYVSGNSTFSVREKQRKAWKGIISTLKNDFQQVAASRNCWVLYEMSNLFRGGLKLLKFAFFCVCVCDKVMLSVSQGHSLCVFRGANAFNVHKLCQGHCKQPGRLYQVRYCIWDG